VNLEAEVMLEVIDIAAPPGDDANSMELPFTLFTKYSGAGGVPEAELRPEPSPVLRFRVILSPTFKP
jgi:hypothetical protein